MTSSAGRCKITVIIGVMVSIWVITPVGVVARGCRNKNKHEIFYFHCRALIRVIGYKKNNPTEAWLKNNRTWVSTGAEGWWCRGVLSYMINDSYNTRHRNTNYNRKKEQNETKRKLQKNTKMSKSSWSIMWLLTARSWEAGDKLVTAKGGYETTHVLCTASASAATATPALYCRCTSGVVWVPGLRKQANKQKRARGAGREKYEILLHMLTRNVMSIVITMKKEHHNAKAWPIDDRPQ